MYILIICMRVSNYFFLFANYLMSSNLASFLHEFMVFHWTLTDRESPQISGILLNILANLNLDDFSSSCLFEFLLQIFDDCSMHLDYKWNHDHFLIFHRFQLSFKIQEFIQGFTFTFAFTLWSPASEKSII